MTTPRCALDKHADLVIIYPHDDGHPDVSKLWHLVLFDSYPARNGRGQYAGLWGARNPFVVARAPNAQQFVLAFYPVDQAEHLDNPRMREFEVVFDKAIAVDHYADMGAAAQYQIETDLFQCQPQEGGSTVAGHMYEPRQPMPDNPMRDLDAALKKMGRRARGSKGKHYPTGVAITPFEGVRQGPSVAEIFLGGTEIEATFSHFDYSLKMDANQDDQVLGLPGFRRLRSPQVIVDLTRFADRAEALAQCFVFSHQALDTGLVRGQRGGQLVTHDGHRLLVHQWPEACPRDRLGLAFFGERLRLGADSDGTSVHKHQLRVYDAVGDNLGNPQLIDVGDEQGVAVSYLELRLGFYQGVMPGITDMAEQNGATEVASGTWHWADQASVVRRAGIDLHEAEGYSAPLLYSYLRLLGRIERKPELQRVLQQVGIDWQSFGSYLLSADAAWAIVSWPTLPPVLVEGRASAPTPVDGWGMVDWFSNALARHRGKSLAPWLAGLSPKTQCFAWAMLNCGLPLAALARHELVLDVLPSMERSDAIRRGLQLLDNDTQGLDIAQVTLEDFGHANRYAVKVDRVSQLPALVDGVALAKESQDKDWDKLRASTFLDEVKEAYYQAAGVSQAGLIAEVGNKLEPGNFLQQDEYRREVRELLQTLQVPERDRKVVDGISSRVVLMVLHRVLSANARLNECGRPLFHWIQKILDSGDFDWAADSGESLSLQQCQQVMHRLIAFERSLDTSRNEAVYGTPRWPGRYRTDHSGMAGRLQRACVEARQWRKTVDFSDAHNADDTEIVIRWVEDTIRRVEDLSDWFATGVVWRRVMRDLSRMRTKWPGDRRVERAFALRSSPPIQWGKVAEVVELVEQETMTKREI